MISTPPPPSPTPTARHPGTPGAGQPEQEWLTPREINKKHTTEVYWELSRTPKIEPHHKKLHPKFKDIISDIQLYNKKYHQKLNHS